MYVYFGISIYGASPISQLTLRHPRTVDTVLVLPYFLETPHPEFRSACYFLHFSVFLFICFILKCCYFIFHRSGRRCLFLCFIYLFFARSFFFSIFLDLFCSVVAPPLTLCVFFSPRGDEKIKLRFTQIIFNEF